VVVVVVVVLVVAKYLLRIRTFGGHKLFNGSRGSIVTHRLFPLPIHGPLISLRLHPYLSIHLYSPSNTNTTPVAAIK